MIEITLETTGFFANKPRVDQFKYPENTIVVDKKDKKVYLGELKNDEISSWFEQGDLQNLKTLKDRVINIKIQRIHDDNNA